MRVLSVPCAPGSAEAARLQEALNDSVMSGRNPAKPGTDRPSIPVWMAASSPGYAGKSKGKRLAKDGVVARIRRAAPGRDEKFLRAAQDFARVHFPAEQFVADETGEVLSLCECQRHIEIECINFIKNGFMHGRQRNFSRAKLSKITLRRAALVILLLI